ncbi:uncharacterized protein ARMOST_21766 [Armillaria ostoyae]|uniref:Guanine nucleotide-binding protein alpha-4 subunit n=1 Tax=Armillaria ostoyae TaxID=47428 RepID=A0A284SB07_ARMOS|nr:uncharacterized protein ARMOST_21766 [Armillaria ostoyae]
MSKRGKANTNVSLDTVYNPFHGPTNLPGPRNETEEEQTRREQESQDAQRISREIDEHLLETKKILERRRWAVKMLLLDFQLAFTPIQFQKERGVWKRIVQLNLINSIKIILDALQSEWSPDIEASTSLHKEHHLLHLRLSPLLVYETVGWKSTLSGKLPRSSDDGLQGRDLLIKNDPTQILEASVDAILSLIPQDYDVSRVTMKDYVPTESDIVRARIRTIGVEEHHFVAESGTEKGSEFFIADVGGSRSSRSSWIPYFDDVDAILFLAPLTFNLSLEEDPRVNRLEDSLQLWRMICENKLLANCALILFLNKKDILVKTFTSGVSVKRYVSSYNDPNDAPHVTKYVKDMFKSYHVRSIYQLDIRDDSDRWLVSEKAIFVSSTFHIL